MNAGTDIVQLPQSSSGSRSCQVQMAAARQLDDDAAELAALAAQRSERYHAAQFRKRSGGFHKVHRTKRKFKSSQLVRAKKAKLGLIRAAARAGEANASDIARAAELEREIKQSTRANTSKAV